MTGRRNRARIAASTAMAFLVLLVAAGGWVYLKLNGNIDTFDADGLNDDRPPVGAGGGNILVIGSDTRATGNKEFGGGEGGVGRSDTALLLHVYADRKHAVAVSIPRDTLVEIPSCRLPGGSWTRPRANAMFNSAFSVGDTAEGNPACTQNTVEKLTGLRVDHTVVVDFKGFARMTSAVGGVPVCVPNDIYEKDLNPKRATRGKRIFTRGTQTVSGQRALDYVRLRHGIGDGSDIGRIQRQQAFVSGLMKKVKKQGFNPTALLPLADAATKSLTVDPGLGSADKLLSFAMSLKDIDLHDTKFVTLPWRYQGERVAIEQEEANALFAALKADRTIDGEDASGRPERPSPRPGSTSPSPTTPVSGAGITVTVYNGTVYGGLAARAAERLRADGFTVTATATAASQNHGTTVIEYGPGERAHARTLARVFPGAEVRSAPAASGLSVILGRSYAVNPSPSPSASTPTAVPSEVADKARSADDDPCSDLSYG